MSIQGKKLWELLEQWAVENAQLHGHSPRTIKKNREQVSRYFRTIGDREHSPQTANWYLQYGQTHGVHPDPGKSKPWSKGTAASEAAFLRAFTSWLHLYQFIPHNFGKQIIKPKNVRAEIPSLSLRKMIEVIEVGNEILPSDRSGVVARKKERKFSLLVIALCALRISEIMSVRGSDLCLDLAEPYMVVTRKGGKRDKVPVGHVDMLSELRQRTKWDFVFMNGYQRVSATDCLSKSFKRGIKILGLDERITPHKVRHATVTETIDNGASPIAVQKVLAHSDLSMTTDTYYQESVHEKQRTQEVFNPLWREQSPPERTLDYIQEQLKKSGVFEDRRFAMSSVRKGKELTIKIQIVG